jgi:hypothetical protein
MDLCMMSVDKVLRFDNIDKNPRSPVDLTLSSICRLKRITTGNTLHLVQMASSTCPLKLFATPKR